MWQLIINGPGYFDTAYDLPEGVTLMGRADENDIVLSGDLVSRKHARIVVTGDHLTVEDLGSRNGSKVNSEPLTTLKGLTPNDRLQVGENTLVIRQHSKGENTAGEMLDLGAGGAVKRFGQGIDIDSAVVLARDVRHSLVMKVLDNVGPFSPSGMPFSDGESASKSAEADLSDHTPKRAMAIAFNSLLLLYRAAEKLSVAASLQEFLEDVADRVLERVGATTAVVLLRHHSGAMVPAAVRHMGKLRKGEVPVSDAIVDAALAKGKAIAVADVRDDSRFKGRDSVVLYGIDQVLCIPIGSQAPWAGVLYLNRIGLSDEPVEDLLDLCGAVAQLIHTGVQRFATQTPTADDRLRRALERSVAPNIVDRQVAEAKKKGASAAQLEEKQVTVLFADLSGLTALAQKLEPDRTLELLNEFYERTTHIIFSFEGTIDRFLGDAVMAVFGAPYSKGDDALRAVRAALAVKAEWSKMLAGRAAPETCDIKVGLDTGKVLVGTVGSEVRLDYTAIGEPMNIASSVCSSATAGQVLITGKTLAAIGARFDVAPRGERPLPGSTARTSVFEVLEEDAGGGTLSGE